MNILQTLTDYFTLVPEWAFLYLVPALAAAFAVAFIFLRQRRWFFVADGVLGAAGFLSVFVRNGALAFVYLGLFTAFSALLSLFFLIPAPKKREKGNKGQSRREKIYAKFHEELSEKPYKPRSAMPPKVCCFEREEEDGATAQECGMSFSYADGLLEKLRAKDLNAGDRLEAEEILRRLDSYRNKKLNGEERDSLNDCLASVLKLTAKYQL